MNSNYKILLLFIEPPLPFGNAASRWFYVLQNELLKRGHDVTTLVVSGIETDIEKSKLIYPNPPHKYYTFSFNKNRNPLGKIKNFFSPHSYKFSNAFYKKLNEINLNSFDIIHAEQTWSGIPLKKYSHKTLLNIHFLTSIDMLYSSPKNLKELLAINKQKSFEKKIIGNFKFIRTCTPRLEDHIKAWKFDQTIFNVPFGIDITNYEYIASEKRNQKKPILTLVGNMNWHPSLSAAERLLTKIWPEVRRTVPHVKLRIAGWSARDRLAKYTNLRDIEIIENFDDIKQIFHEATALIYVPPAGSGMKIKIQEAMAFGVPVITNSEGAEGLQVKDMQHMAIANKDKDIIERTRIVLENFDIQESLRKNSRNHIASFCSPENTVNSMEKCYQTILSANKNTGIIL